MLSYSKELQPWKQAVKGTAASDCCPAVQALLCIRTFVNAIFWNVDVHSSLDGSTLDVLQLFDSFFAHVLQLADMVIHIWNFNLACCSCAPSCYLSKV